MTCPAPKLIPASLRDGVRALSGRHRQSVGQSVSMPVRQSISQSVRQAGRQAGQACRRALFAGTLPKLCSVCQWHFYIDVRSLFVLFLNFACGDLAQTEFIINRQWPEVYDLCHTFLHIARVGHARIARENTQTC